MNLKQISPIFPVRDLEKTLAHYGRLGFTANAYRDGAFYGFADRDDVGIHFSLIHEHEHDGEHVHEHPSRAEAYLYVDDADALYAEWSSADNTGITRHVHETPYQLREGSHLDVDGNLIRFGSPVDGPSDAVRLREHLQSHHHIEIEKMTELDVGVFRVDRRNGRSWVARLFPPLRTIEAVHGDAEILRFLASVDFPAERCSSEESVSVLGGRGVLVTDYVEGVPREQRRNTIRDLGGLVALGELLGQLHEFAPRKGIDRPGGAWHHLADGSPSLEIAAAGRLLDRAAGMISNAEHQTYEVVKATLASLDDGAELPEALVHPDFVLPNVVASPDVGMVLVDWAGSGRAARLWSLAFLLFAEGAKDLRRIDRVVAGYRRHVELTQDELERIGALALARPAILEVWRFCMGQKSLSDVVRDIEEMRQLANSVAERTRLAFDP